ncbi:hypothetical protein BGX26_005713, partial [Mortierella sp. AD094]
RLHDDDDSDDNDDAGEDNSNSDYRPPLYGIVTDAESWNFVKRDPNTLLPTDSVYTISQVPGLV